MEQALPSLLENTACFTSVIKEQEPAETLQQLERVVAILYRRGH